MELEKVSRKYPIKDVKLLFMLSAGMCAYPGCNIRCVEKETDLDDPIVLAKIAHIEAHSDNGPRSNPSMTAEERDSYENWILLCGVHHDLIDGQSKTYTVSTIKNWKVNLEKKIDEQLKLAMTEVTFTELEQVTEAIVSSVENKSVSNDFHIIPPEEKIQKNELGTTPQQYLLMGMLQARVVEQYINDIGSIIPSYPEKLSQGFKVKYVELKHERGLIGDELFYEMIRFSTPNLNDPKRFAAGIAVLSYLFSICEVFEK